MFCSCCCGFHIFRFYNFEIDHEIEAGKLFTVAPPPPPSLPLHAPFSFVATRGPPLSHPSHGWFISCRLGQGSTMKDRVARVLKRGHPARHVEGRREFCSVPEGYDLGYVLRHQKVKKERKTDQS